MPGKTLCISDKMLGGSNTEGPGNGYFWARENTNNFN